MTITYTAGTRVETHYADADDAERGDLSYFSVDGVDHDESEWTAFVAAVEAQGLKVACGDELASAEPLSDGTVHGQCWIREKR